MSRLLIYSTLLKENRIEKEMTWEERKVLFVAQGEHCSKSFGIIQTWVKQRSRINELIAATDIYILAFRMPVQERCGTSELVKVAFFKLARQCQELLAGIELAIFQYKHNIILVPCGSPTIFLISHL